MFILIWLFLCVCIKQPMYFLDAFTLLIYFIIEYVSATSRKIYYKLISLCDLHINKIVTCARVFHVLGIYMYMHVHSNHKNDLFVQPVYIMTQLIILSLEYMYCQCRGAICLWVTGWNLYKACFVLEIIYLVKRTKRNLIFKTALFSLFWFFFGGGGNWIGRS